MSDTDTDIAKVMSTLVDLRGLLEAQQTHLAHAADRHRDLSNHVSDLQAELNHIRRSLAMLTQRVDELRPPRLNCPHCGAAIQKDWANCRLCTKPLK